MSLPACARERAQKWREKKTSRASVSRQSALYTAGLFLPEEKESVLQLHNVKMYLNLSLLDFSFKKILSASLMLMKS